ncbi:hypothetical protein J2S55_003199 [Streptosporangium brasiliense]|uniref:Uncharacterized protein n=1 Tax=Streptosporangium brasiliense TaxID=47480 RepID=A0ABT9R433_9ACTN|nr:hypothetical protein [Streptosporangium brasiliense]
MPNIPDVVLRAAPGFIPHTVPEIPSCRSHPDGGGPGRSAKGAAASAGMGIGGPAFDVLSGLAPTAEGSARVP